MDKLLFLLQRAMLHGHIFSLYVVGRRGCCILASSSHGRVFTKITQKECFKGTGWWAIIPTALTLYLQPRAEVEECQLLPQEKGALQLRDMANLSGKAKGSSMGSLVAYWKYREGAG